MSQAEFKPTSKPTAPLSAVDVQLVQLGPRVVQSAFSPSQKFTPEPRSRSAGYAVKIPLASVRKT